MKLPAGPMDGAQPRSFVIDQLIYFGVGVQAVGDDCYELTDNDGDAEVVLLDDPVPSRMIVHLWRRFGHHGMLITDFVCPIKPH